MKLEKPYIVAYWLTFASYIIVFVVLMLTIGYDYNRAISDVWIKRVALVIMLVGWGTWYLGRKKLGHGSIDIDPLGEIARRLFHPKSKKPEFSPEKVVDKGIYRITRHPQYWGTVLFYLGLSVALESIPALVASLITVLPAHIWRAIVEERMLVNYFGQAYVEYRKKVKL